MSGRRGSKYSGTRYTPADDGPSAEAVAATTLISAIAIASLVIAIVALVRDDEMLALPQCAAGQVLTTTGPTGEPVCVNIPSPPPSPTPPPGPSPPPTPNACNLTGPQCSALERVIPASTVYAFSLSDIAPCYMQEGASLPPFVPYNPPNGSLLDQGWEYARTGPGQYFGMTIPTGCLFMGNVPAPLDDLLLTSAPDLSTIYAVITMTAPFDPGTSGLFFNIYTQKSSVVTGGTWYARRSDSVPPNAETWPIGQKILVLAGIDPNDPGLPPYGGVLHPSLPRFTFPLELTNSPLAPGPPDPLTGRVLYIKAGVSTTEPSMYGLIMHEMGYYVTQGYGKVARISVNMLGSLARTAS